MATLLRYVDPDVVGGLGDGSSWENAYSSLNSCIAGQAQNLTDGGGDIMSIQCRSSAGTNDTAAVVEDGFTTNATCYLEITGTDFPTNGVLDTTKYTIALTNSTLIQIDDDYVRLHNLQLVGTTTGTGTTYGIHVAAVATSHIRIDSCIIKGICSGTGTAYGIYVSDSSATVRTYNCLIYNWKSGTDTTHAGARISAGSSVIFYNCTFWGNYYGLYRTAGTVTAKNCAVGNNNDDFSGTMTVDYCCSDDGDGTNAQNPSGGDWANEFNNAGGGNFSLKSGGNCVGHGTDDPSGGIYSDDIIGFGRTSVWDIGAFEYQPPAAGLPVPVAMHHSRLRRFD
jgi:hypothetical protein